VHRIAKQLFEGGGGHALQRLAGRLRQRLDFGHARIAAPFRAALGHRHGVHALRMAEQQRANRVQAVHLLAHRRSRPRFF
jgi:hypothetical protein